jgi:Uma2 family endonuclease
MTVHARTSELRIVDPDDDTILSLTPIQGLWTEEQYLVMTDHSRRLLEFDDGYIEVLPMPIPEHQKILALLYERFVAFVRPRGGITLFAPLRVRIRPGKFREPDLVVLQDANDPRQQQRYWLGVDLAVEVVSADDPERDTSVKRVDYAEAGIPEYWIVNPLDQTISVLVLAEANYVEHGRFVGGTQATSQLLEGFSLSVDEVFGVSS